MPGYYSLIDKLVKGRLNSVSEVSICGNERSTVPKSKLYVLVGLSYMMGFYDMIIFK